MFRATVTRVFELRGRGTVIAVDIRDGTIKAGDAISVHTSTGSRTLHVLAVELLDSDIGRPSFRSELALIVDGALASDISVGEDVIAAAFARPPQRGTSS